MNALVLAASLLASAPVEVSFLFCYNPDHPEEPATRRILDLARADPEVSPVKWGGLVLPGAGGRSTFMLALAGGTAPDIYKAWFHVLRHDVAQGFVYPLDEWVGGERGTGSGEWGTGSGEWRRETLDERRDAVSPRLPSGVSCPSRSNPQTFQHSNTSLWDRVRCFDGHVWALPTPGTAYYGIVYRKDLVSEAGLDPESPPRTWSEFRSWCEKLTRPGRRAFAIENRPWGFLPWVQSAGGDVIRERGMGNGEQGMEYEACFDSPAALKAAEFLQSLVRLGVVRGMPTLTVADDIGQLFVSGEIVSVFGGEDLVLRLTETLAMPPEAIGLMPFPAADDGGVRVLQAHRHFYAMSESAGHRPKEERDVIWKCLSTLAAPELADEEILRNVAEGRARWCRPADLRRLGLEEELKSVPKSVRDMYDDLEAGRIKAVTEPWVGFWQGASDIVQRRFLGVLLSDAGADFDCAAALRSITEDANRGLMFESDRSGIERARPYARMILGALICSVLVSAWLVWRRKRESETAVAKAMAVEPGNGDCETLDEGREESTRLSSRVSCQSDNQTTKPNHLTIGQSDNQTTKPNRRTIEQSDNQTIKPNHRTIKQSNNQTIKHFSLSPWLFLAPAVLSILLWSYYPLVRGAVMAFQDYKIVGDATFAGLDNFIRVATDPGFWSAWGRTLEYVLITLVLGFVTPVLLAVMLCEIPRGKVLFRFLYFLPHLTSALVVTLLWKLMFDPTENGILNQVLASVGIARHSWLQDPSWAMVCCIIPGVWAGAGISSLIYIAALSSLPQDYYEAAAIDGAGFLARLRHVTLPQLAPLMVINFVGAFIAAFQGMGAIFLLTFGGPGDATQVLSLQIWKEAYNNLRFSTATTMAWFLGVALIGFTYLQIRFLRRVEFRRAAAA